MLFLTILTIDDINGNGNGIMETGESIMATIANEKYWC